MNGGNKYDTDSSGICKDAGNAAGKRTGACKPAY